MKAIFYVSMENLFSFHINKANKIRDLFKVKLYTIRSETKRKREREERDKHVNPGTDRGVIKDPINPIF